MSTADRTVDLSHHHKDELVTGHNFAQVLAALPVAVYVCEAPGGAIRFWNKRAVELWGQEPVLGDAEEKFCSALRTSHTDNTPLAGISGPAAAVLQSDQSRSDEVELARSDGSRVTIQFHSAPLRDLNGRLTGTVNTFQDITVQKKVERSIQDSFKTVERLYRLTDRLGRAQALDEVCEAALECIVEAIGIQRASILIFDDHDVMRFRAWRGLSAAYRAAVDGHSPWTADTTTATPILVDDILTDSNLATLRDVISAEGIRALGFIPITDAGRLLGKFMLYCDTPHRFSVEEVHLATTIAHHVAFSIARARADAAVTAALEREREARAEADAARAEAERVNRAKDEFLAMLAHELRNPLSVISNTLAVLEGASESANTRFRDIIERQTGHLTRLLDDLLDVARVTTGQIQLHTEPIDLRTVVEFNRESYQCQASAKGQQLNVSMPQCPVMVSGDQVRLQQVLGNLVNNASKYTSVGGALWVTLEIQRDNAVLRVRDNGAGIAPDQLEWVFELFAQANTTLARSEGGLGIGLTVAKRLVELHNGGIRAISEGVNRGTEMIVELPLMAIPVVPAPTASTRPRVTRRRILVIEDSEDGREVLTAALQLHGHEVFNAATGRDGIRQARLHAPDLVLIDLGLPDIDGYTVAHELAHSLNPSTRLVALTGYGSKADRTRSEEAGFHAHLLKPIPPAQLVTLLERVLTANDSLGSDARLDVRAPIEADASEGIVAEGAGETKGLRVLIVEDNVDVAQSFGALLELLGHRVWLFHDAPPALEALDKVAFDLGVVDIGLRGMSGYELAKCIRQHGKGKNLFLVAFSGHSSEAEQNQSRKAGFDRHLAKPLAGDTLRALLQEVALLR